MPQWVVIIAMAIGVIAILRATAIIATGGAGRFRADPLITAFIGFGLLVLGRYVLQ